MATLVTAADLVGGQHDGRLVREVYFNGDLAMTVGILRGAVHHMGRVRVTRARLGYVFDDLQAATPGADASERMPLEQRFYIMGAAAEPHQQASAAPRCGAPYCVLELEHVGGHRVPGQAADARDSHGCFCPGDCGCNNNGRPNVCGCAAAKHAAAAR